MARGSSRTALRPGAVFLALALGGCGGAAAPAPQEAAWFEEDALRSGLDFVHVSGFERRWYFPEIVCGGVALFDHDGDGDLDVYLVQAGDLEPGGRELPSNRLYSNRGDGTFEDVTERAGVGDRGYGMGAACGDYDGDGDVDLYVTNFGPDVLYRNEGDGTFTDVTAQAGVGHPGWSSSAAFADVDGDGALDLFVVSYLRWSKAAELVCFFRGDQRDYCHPENYQASAPDVLYRNLGDGTFRDSSEEAGLRAAYGNGLGVACGDFDGDGMVDIYVANDMNANQLWINQGDGRFADRALASGCALSGSGFPESGMGVAAVDLEGDGHLDLFLSHLRGQSNTFYSGDGRSFDDATARMGLHSPSMPYTGFGLGFADFDHDGDLDLFVANGAVMMEEPIVFPADPYAQENLLFEQTAPGRFEERLPRGGTAARLFATSRGAAFGDLDGDGDVDAVVVNRDGRVHLLRNQASGGRHWVLLKVVDRSGSDAVGASVRLHAGGRTQWRRIDPAYGYCSSNDPRAHFGLGAARRADEVVVRWPDGTESAWSDLEGDRVHVLRR